MISFIISKLITIYIVTMICVGEGIYYTLYYAKRDSKEMRKEIEALPQKKVLQFSSISSLPFPSPLGIVTTMNFSGPSWSEGKKEENRLWFSSFFVIPVRNVE